jgi:hypothetical protein
VETTQVDHLLIAQETPIQNGPIANTMLSKESTKPAEEEEIDIDLEDPEVEKAAAKIQATFRRIKLGKSSKPSPVR